MAVVEFFYDFSCPYAYLASTQVEAICARHGARLTFHPMLLGGVFKARQVPQNLAATMSPAKARHNVADMHRWADYWGVTLRMPSNHPQRTVNALRLVLAAPEAARWPLAQALYRAYWVLGLDVSSDAVLRDCALSVGLSEEVLAHAQSEPVKKDLFDRTDEAVQRGVFGAPTMFVGDVMLWGQDRLLVLDRMLGGAQAPLPAAQKPHHLRVIFDLSSPFSYLGVSQVEALCARHQVRLVWHPVLLGGLFRLVGAPEVPLYAMHEARQAFQIQDILRYAAQYGVPFQFSPHFPLRTVTAQRLIVAALEAGAPQISAFIRRLYCAAWADAEDLSSEPVLRRCCKDVGLDAASLYAQAQSPAIKQRLFDLTQQAADLGAFGAPTWILDDQDLLWGQDRLPLLDWMLSRA